MYVGVSVSATPPARRCTVSTRSPRDPRSACRTVRYRLWGLPFVLDSGSEAAATGAIVGISGLVSSTIGPIAAVVFVSLRPDPSPPPDSSLQSSGPFLLSPDSSSAVRSAGSGVDGRSRVRT
ncbi:hypothetical protein D8S78_11090 [Natrialba swarupiae]|nr:hypothetical protein [Natrialba swarupiae]